MIKTCKILFFSIVLCGLFSFINLVQASGCVECHEGNQECQRVVIGNTVHIFYGEAKSCDSDT